jgi:D-alanine-D-alanine ligase
MPDNRPVVAVLFGGRSSEHSVSCVSAVGVLSSLDDAAYRILPIGVTREGTWRLVPDWQDFAFDAEAMPEVEDDGTAIFVSPTSADHPLVERRADGSTRRLGSVDVFFPLLHGPYGEDGTVQGLFELMGAAYVGPGVFGSAAAMDKHFTKVVLTAAGISTTPWVTIRQDEYTADAQAAHDAVIAQGFPAFVKPARAGSSVGISKVHDASGLAAAFTAAFAHDTKVIVEPGVVAREVECAVLGSFHDTEPATSWPSEITFGAEHEFYDFEAKYLDGASQVTCPAELPEAVTEEVRRVARKTFQAFEGSGLARVDTFVLDDGSVLVNELNTLPGFTPSSAYPMMWARTGVEFPELLNRLIAIALRDRTR